MAEKLEHYEFNRRNGRGIYPWAEWANGEIWKATRGLDFTVSTTSFRGNLSGYAMTHYLHVRTSIDGDCVIFQFSREPFPFVYER